MKRYGIFGILVLIVTLMTALMAGAAVIKGSKHDLSYRTTGTVLYMSADLASGGTTEICVFCHTPHGGNTAAPLWNRANVGAVVTPYSSDVMSALSYTVGDSDLGTGALHAKTRICLSCHDGTIAMGNLANLPQGLSANIPILNTVGGLMPQAAAGFIGTNLSDDHPVAIRYVGLTPDPELRSTPSTISPGPGGPIRLYTSAGTDYIECTSCHNPHDNQYGNFLVGSNTQSGICIACHNKAGFASSIHGTPNVSFPYAPPTGGAPSTLGANVGEVKCMNCHFPHKAGVLDTNKTNPAPTQGKYLLSFNEEQSCFNTNNDRWSTSGSNTACHGSASPAARNIQLEVEKASAHKVKNYSGVHQATEGKTFGWGVGKWHVECADCHNPHTAGTTLHTVGTNTIAGTSVLFGVGGVKMESGPASWGSPGALNYSPFEPLGLTISSTWPLPHYEYEICFKCHSSWGGGFPTTTMTDQAKEFNRFVTTPNPLAYHPVMAANTNTLGDYTGGWNNGSQTMYCSDCHNKNGGGNPQGPHGSTNPYLLYKVYTYDDVATPKTAPAQPSTDICFDCHVAATYLTPAVDNVGNTGFKVSGGNNLHRVHADRATTSGISTYAYRCVNCHIRIPHGWPRKAMVYQSSDGASYGSIYLPVTAATITGFVNGNNLPASNSYGATKGIDCYTANGCHQ